MYGYYREMRNIAVKKCTPFDKKAIKIILTTCLSEWVNNGKRKNQKNMEYKILVVDDESDLREILQCNLENAGYQVDTAESAEEALQKLTPDCSLILLDVMLGGMSGFKLAEKLRKDLKNNVPIIFLTARDTENDMLTGFSSGGDDYIS